MLEMKSFPNKNITLDHAYELSEYDPCDGWILEMWPEWEGVEG